MTFIDAKEIHCKLVYYGPGLGGKTSNLQYIHNKSRPEAKTPLLSHATETERTLFFSLQSLSMGEVHGRRPRFHIYTVPGTVYYEVSRRLVLKDVDAIVFVADSQRDRLATNVESLAGLGSLLAHQGRELARVPLVMQYNKRDLPGAMPVAALDEALNPGKAPTFEAVAMNGVGVFETLKGVAKLMIDAARERGV